MKEILLYGGIAVTVLFTILYFVILYFYPEWVGISGKDSQKTLDSHKQEESDESF